jgi:RNA polymerase sigma-70 factor (ECF subfamily)
MRMKERKTIHSSKKSPDILAQQSLNGNEDAFEELFKRYRPVLFHFIFKMLGDYDQACDIEQQVFLQLYKSLPTLDTTRTLKSWLFQVARNRCLDEFRRKRIIHFSELEALNDEDGSAVLALVPDPHPQPEEIAENHELQEHLLKVIRRLPPKFRSVVFLRYAAQLTFPEIGKTLGMPAATAKTYFTRAKPLLRASLVS